MPNIRYYNDSKQYHLTPRNEEGFNVPEELWERYLMTRPGWVWFPAPHLKAKFEILMYEREWKRLTKSLKYVTK